MSQERRNDKIKAMRRHYPSLRLVENTGGDELVWEGCLCPLRSVNDLNALLNDIENDREVQIIGGELSEIAHHSDCDMPHTEHRLTELIQDPIREFRVRIVDFGTNQQPEATVLDSPIPPELWRHRWGERGICAYAPWEYPWSAETSSIVEFVDHSLIWLFKQNVYSQTKVWIGKEMSHNTDFLFKTIGPTHRCFCGSEKDYGACHQDAHGRELYGIYWIFFKAWLTHVQDSRYRRLETIVSWLPKKFASPLKTKAQAR